MIRSKAIELYYYYNNVTLAYIANKIAKNYNENLGDERIYSIIRRFKEIGTLENRPRKTKNKVIIDDL